MKLNTLTRTARLAFVLGLLLVGLGFWAPLALAASYTVNTLDDNTTDNTACTLREAISAANNSAANDDCGAASSGDDTISFSVSGTIYLQSTLPNIVSGQGKLVIDGGSAITISGDSDNNNAADVQIIVVDSSANLTLQNLIVTRGTAITSGGAIRNNGGTLTISNSTFSANSSTGNGNGGGAIYNDGGTTTINNSAFSANSGTYGGAIYNFGGTTTVSNSTFFNNIVQGCGGAIFNQNLTATISNSTFSANSAGEGGAICNFSGTTTISNSTFSTNSASNGSSIWNNNGETTTIKNSVIASNGSNNCYNLGTFNSQGVNFSTDNTCTGFTQKTLTEINLGPLANNGGLTQTHALLAGSQAIDAVSDCTFSGGGNVTQDQRGTIRPQDGQCDLGAFEAVLYSLTVNKNGSGSVSDSLATVDCSALCTLPAVTLVTLAATGNVGSYFTSWSDCDSIIGNQCVVNIFNSDKAVTANFATDTTAPTVNVTGVVNGAQYNPGSVPTPGCSTSDSESGVATAATLQVTPNDESLGQHTATCTGATDNAGNAQAAPVSVTYSIVTTTTCLNVQVQASQKIIFSPRPSKLASKTISMTIRNNSGTDIQVLAVALDGGKFSADYTLNGVLTQFGRHKVTLPQTIVHRGRLTVKVVVQKAAGTAKETLFAPFFNVTLSCGVLSASEPIAFLPIEIATLLETLRESERVQVQICTLNGKKLLDETVTLAEASQLQLSERMANGVYLYRLTVYGKDGSMQHRELKKILIQR